MVDSLSPKERSEIMARVRATGGWEGEFWVRRKDGKVFLAHVLDATIEDASKLSFTAEVDGKIVAAAAWTEMFTVETAFAACRQSFLSAVESLLTE